MTEWFTRPVIHVSTVEASLRFYVDRLEGHIWYPTPSAAGRRAQGAFRRVTTAPRVAFRSEATYGINRADVLWWENLYHAASLQREHRRYT